LELYDLADGGNGVVASVVVHCQFFLLTLDLGGDWELNSASERLETKVGVGMERFTRVCGDDTDSVGRGLSESGGSVVRETADSAHDALEVLSGEVGRPEVLNHVVEDEEGKLVALLLSASEASGNDLVADPLDKVMNERLVGLEKSAHQLSGSDLKIELI
jgi:hypothetical protein